MNDHEDLLVTRIVDRTATHEDWVAFEDVARVDPTAWDRMHAALQDDVLLRKVLGPAFEIADAIELPRIPAPPPLGRFLAPAGWLAALVLALLWIGTSGVGSRPKLPGDSGPQVVEGVRNANFTQKDPRDVLEELPPDVLEWQPREDGSVEMVWLRRTVERTVVDTVYRMAEDELGNPRPMLLNTKKLASPRVY